jgi:hypothetical protein
MDGLAKLEKEWLKKDRCIAVIAALCVRIPTYLEHQMGDIFKGEYGQHSLAHKISTVLENKISLNEEDCSCNYHEKKLFEKY